MAESFVRLPDEAALTGKRVRTNTRTVSATEVHEHLFQLIDPSSGDAITATTTGSGNVAVDVNIATVTGTAPLNVDASVYDGSGNAILGEDVPGGRALVVTLKTRFDNFQHSTLGVTTSSQQALASNSARKYALFQNDSDTTIYLKIGAAAVVGQGIRLNANGGSYEINHFNLVTGAVNAIHGGVGSKTLLVAESDSAD